MAVVEGSSVIGEKPVMKFIDAPQANDLAVFEVTIGEHQMITPALDSHAALERSLEFLDERNAETGFQLGLLDRAIKTGRVSLYGSRITAVPANKIPENATPDDSRPQPLGELLKERWVNYDIDTKKAELAGYVANPEPALRPMAPLKGF